MKLKNIFSNLPRLGFICVVLIAFLQGCEEKPINVSAIGDPAPAFELDMLDGSKWQMAEHTGNPVVLSFMASWCPCSKESIPIVKEAYQIYSPQGVEFLIVGIQDARSKWEGFVKKKEVPFPAGFDGDESIARSFGIKVPPTTVFIDKAGKVNRVYYGNINDIGRESYFEWFKEVL